MRSATLMSAVVSAILLVTISCQKRAGFTTANVVYHIENGDTLSGVIVPTAFTPDGDGINDVFKPVTFGINDYGFRVYSKNNLIFESFHPDQGWNGSTVDLNSPFGGTYTWMIFGADTTGFDYNMTGRVTIMN